jgi:hypothetical protein
MSLGKYNHFQLHNDGKSCCANQLQ